MKKLKLAVSTLLIMILAGCVQMPVTEANRESQLSISSVRDKPTSYSKGSTFTILPKFIESSTFSNSQVQGIYSLYEQNIKQQLIDAGYQIADSGKGDFEVGFAIALEKDVSDQLLSEKFGISPGLHVTENMEKGSFLIYIEDTATKQRVWRGAVQGFVHDELTVEKREQRTSHIVNAIVSQFFNAG